METSSTLIKKLHNQSIPLLPQFTKKDMHLLLKKLNLTTTLKNYQGMMENVIEEQSTATFKDQIPDIYVDNKHNLQHMHEENYNIYSVRNLTHIIIFSKQKINFPH